MCLGLSDCSQSLPGDQSVLLIPWVVRSFGLTSGIVAVTRLLELGIEPGGKVSPSLKVNCGSAFRVPPYGCVTRPGYETSVQIGCVRMGKVWRGLWLNGVIKGHVGMALSKEKKLLRYKAKGAVEVTVSLLPNPKSWSAFTNETPKKSDFLHVL